MITCMEDFDAYLQNATDQELQGMLETLQTFNCLLENETRPIIEGHSRNYIGQKSS